LKPGAAVFRMGRFDFARMISGNRFTEELATLTGLLTDAYGEYYDIVAKAEDNSAPGRLKLMLQALFADRFQLALRHETKIKEDGVTPKALMFRGRGQIEGRMASVPMLASYLSTQVGRTVLDKTGLTAVYDFTLKWTPDESLSGRLLDALRPPIPTGRRFSRHCRSRSEN
jgi:uncharacterized protein DUF3738